MSPSRATTVPVPGNAAPAPGASLERDVLSIRDFGADLETVIEAALTLKRLNKTGHPTPFLAGKSACLIFEKPSTRTRVSFEIGLAKLGMTSVVLNARDIQLGRGESIQDTALVLSRYADVLVYRAHRATDVAALAAHARVPVVNALDDVEHPCQVAADLLTLLEHKGRLAGLRFLYVGDGNNMSHSYLLGCAAVGMHVTVCTPSAFAPDPAIVREARALAKAAGGSVHVTTDPETAFDGQDVIATDTWVSMGDEDEKEARIGAFRGFTVTRARMTRAAPDALFLHCLPAYYGLEVDKDVAHGPQSVIWDEAENRLWAQMGILVWLLAPWRLRALAEQAADA